MPARVQAPALTAGHQRLVMDWYQPSHNAGPVTDYGVQYRQGSSGDWTDWTRKGAATANLDTLTGLTNGASYQAQVRARNKAGWGAWSPSSTATPADNRAITLSKASLSTSEAGTAKYTVKLGAKPDARVKVTLTKGGAATAT